MGQIKDLPEEIRHRYVRDALKALYQVDYALDVSQPSDKVLDAMATLRGHLERIRKEHIEARK